MAQGYRWLRMGSWQIRVTWPTRRQQSATCPSQHTKLMKRNQKPVKSAWGSTWTCIWWTSWSDADEQISDLYEPEIQIRDETATATQIWGWGLGRLNNAGRRSASGRCAARASHASLLFNGHQPSDPFRALVNSDASIFPWSVSFTVPGAPEASCARRGAGRF